MCGSKDFVDADSLAQPLVHELRRCDLGSLHRGSSSLLATWCCVLLVVWAQLDGLGRLLLNSSWTSRSRLHLTSLFCLLLFLHDFRRGSYILSPATFDVLCCVQW